MERLTKRDIKLSQIRNIPHETFYYKLQQIEDFMEDNDIKDFEELKRILTTNAVWQENQALKDKWNKLKEIVSVELGQDAEQRDSSTSEFAKEMYDNFTCVEEWVLGQMQELENVADINVGEIGNDNNVSTKEAIKVTKALKGENQ